ncbi:hypothetical protein VNI00_015638 [Paramarasmius palmivorus]|uniref:DUF1793-domain-containing protein n=1 Tax=Paramarasmius palmivorus TaxID=297713 RepID=A0AAW0BK54_9AGAR
MIQFAALAVVAYLSTFVTFSDAQFRPSAVPLLVRSPYFSSWVSPNATSNWPQFWSGNQILGWGGFIRVDGSLYQWMGGAFNDSRFNNLAGGNNKMIATVDDITITPTRTIYSLSAGPMRFNFTFLSPIEPEDLALQSFPFGYVYFEAASGDGDAHNVQVYSDLSGEWLSEDSWDTINWSTLTTISLVFHAAYRNVSDKLAPRFMAHDGSLYHATLARSNMTWQTGGGYALRSWFLTHGNLNGTEDDNFRDIRDNWPVFAFAKDLGTIKSTSQPVVWAVGYARTPVVRYSVTSEELQPYWTTRYRRIDDGIQAFLEDFLNAKSRAESLDDKILSEARKVSLEYANLVSLSARQTFGGVETAVSSNGDALMFMRDVGTSGRVNPVETIYASFPAFLYINTTWCRYLLEPLLQYQQSSSYTDEYAAPDLGIGYPIAEGRSVDTVRSIDDSGSMLIMAWAHARFSGDQGLLNTYFTRRWSLYRCDGSEDADGLRAANLTNLVLKGIIGVRAMAEISHTLGKDDDANKYQNQSMTWIKDWEHAASVSGHLGSSYNSIDSWGMIYNLFADKLLGLKLIYDTQDSFYFSLLGAANTFGLPLGSNSSAAKSHWTMLTAATANDASTRDSLLQGVYDKAVDINQFAPFPSTYDAGDGEVVTGRASPAQGAAFSLLAMGIVTKLAGIPGGSQEKATAQLSIGAQAGIGIGLASLVLIVLVFLLWWGRRKHTHTWHPSQKEGRMAALFRFRRSSNLPVNVPEDTLTDYRIEPFTTQKNQLQHRVNAEHTSRKRYECDPDLLRQTQEQADLGSNSRAEENVAIRAAHTRSGSLSSSARGHADDTHSLRNTVEHLRRTIQELQSRVYGPPPSYRAGSPSSSPR